MKYSWDSIGNDLETELTERMAANQVDMWGHNTIKVSTYTQDRDEGTDVFVCGIPVDITLNTAKNHTFWFKNTIDLDYMSIMFGLRRRNGRSKFLLPVLVMCIVASVSRDNYMDVVNMLIPELKAALDIGMDLYLDAVE